ncbi:MAG: T9SS type A sorting domain-containing protein [Bacteroidales bacterium]|jgi:hypothetical protein|nr:T9SS type A sorting domain-containing protein [Bacteroidales bacterium]
MKRAITYIIVFIAASTALNAQYISKVHEYVPAPSQYMNAAPWGLTSSAESIIGDITGHVSLGAFGGYIVFSFDEPVENDPSNPFGVDFTIFGNPIPGWSEPGIVSVMKDENQNGEPDDTWYELAGSDYNFSTSIRDYSVSYSNPSGHDSLDIPWTDNLGNNGLIETNSFYLQNYYPLADSFPDISRKSYSLNGSMLRSTVDTTIETGIHSLTRGFGYADNQFRGKPPYTYPDNPYTSIVENSGGDAFDISWAVDSTGNYIELDKIDFIKVHTGVMDGAGWLGQISTEITGAVDVLPEKSAKGNYKLLVIREIPLLLDTANIQLEVFAFENGRLIHDGNVQWSSNLSTAYVDGNDILHVSQSGELTVTAHLLSDQSISSSVSTTVDLGTYTKKEDISIRRILNVYPNPAQELIRIPGGDWNELTILDVSGKIVVQRTNILENESIDISYLSSGIYFIRAVQNSISYSGKFIRK